MAKSNASDISTGMKLWIGNFLFVLIACPPKLLSLITHSFSSQTQSSPCLPIWGRTAETRRRGCTRARFSASAGNLSFTSGGRGFHYAHGGQELRFLAFAKGATAQISTSP